MLLPVNSEEALLLASVYTTSVLFMQRQLVGQISANTHSDELNTNRSEYGCKNERQIDNIGNNILGG